MLGGEGWHGLDGQCSIGLVSTEQFEMGWDGIGYPRCYAHAHVNTNTIHIFAYTFTYAYGDTGRQVRFGSWQARNGCICTHIQRH